MLFYHFELDRWKIAVLFEILGCFLYHRHFFSQCSLCSWFPVQKLFLVAGAISSAKSCKIQGNLAGEFVLNSPAKFSRFWHFGKKTKFYYKRTDLADEFTLNSPAKFCYFYNCLADDFMPGAKMDFYKANHRCSLHMAQTSKPNASPRNFATVLIF